MGVRQAVTVIGAFVGAAFGNPQLGFMLGSLVGGFLDPEVIDGPKVGDIATQTSAEGVPCPLLAGTAGCAGNIIFKGPVDKVYTNEGGKGAPPEQRVERLYCTYAIRIGASLFTAPGNRTSRLSLIKIWQFEKLVYDVSPESTILEESEAFAEANNLAFYPGDEEQLPDPMLEAIRGAGNVPSYRGRAYVRMRSDITDGRGAVSQFRFEVSVDAGSPKGVSLITDVKHYAGSRTALEPAATAMGWTAGIDRVRVSPDGLHAFGFAKDSAIPPPEWKVYDPEADTWSAMTPPASMPVSGVLCAQWHPDNLHLAVGTNTNAWPNNLILYKLVAGVITRVAASADPLPNEIILGLAWDEDGSRLGLAKGNSAAGGGLYDFVSGAFTNLREFGSNFLDTGSCVAFQPGVGSRYLALGHLSADVSLYRISAGSVDRCGAVELANARVGVHWDRTGAYLYTVGSTAPDYVQVWAFQGSVILYDETLELVGPADDQPVSAPRDSAVSGDGQYLAIATGGLTIPLVYQESSTLPPTLDRVTDVATAGAVVDSVSWAALDIGTVAPGLATLDQVILATGARCKMPAGLFDVAHLSGDVVRGLVVASQNYTGQDLLNALRWVYLLDGADYDGQIHFPKRGGAVAFAITDDDLVDEQDDGEQDETLRNFDDKRKAPIRRPLKLNLMFPNRTVGYELTKATSPHYGDRGEAVSEVTLEVPVVLSDTDEAPQLADKLEKIGRADAEGEIARIVHEGIGAKLTAGDVGTLTEGDLVRRTRVETYRDGNGTKRLLLRVDRPHAYSSQVAQQSVPAPPAPPPSLPGDTQFVVLNIPGVIDSDDRLGVRIGVCGLPDTAWSGALVRISTDAGNTFENLVTITTRARIGELLAPVTAASEFYPDATNFVQVAMLDDDDLESLTTSELLQERNAFAIAYADGTAEVMQYRDATDDGDGEWSLSYLLRGRLATEADAHEAGDKFVLLAGTVFVPLPSSLIGQTITLQFVSLYGQADGSPTFTFVWDPVVAQTEFPAADLVLARATNTITAEVIPRHRFGSEMNPIASVNFDGYRFTATAGVNSSTVDTGRTDPTASFDVTGWSTPVTVTVALLNRYTGAGPTYSEAIA